MKLDPFIKFIGLWFCLLISFSGVGQMGDSTQIEQLNQSAFELRNSNPDSALVLVKEALNIAEKINHSEGKALSYSRMGVVLQRLGQYQEALEMFQKSIGYYQSINQPSKVGEVYCNIGIVYKKKGDFDLALGAYLNGLDLLEDESSKAFVYNNLANLYSLQENYNKAVGYYQLSLKIAEQEEDQKGISRTYQNLGILYSELDSLDLAKSYLLKSLVIEDQLGSRMGLANLNAQLGYLEELQSNYVAAESYYLKNLEILKVLDQKEDLAYGFNSLGVVYTLTQQYSKAESHFTAALELSNELGAKDLKSEVYFNLSNLYETLRQFERSLLYFQKHAELKDSIFNEVKSQQFNELTTQYETEKKERDILILKRQNELNTIKIAKQKGDIINQKLLLVVSFLMVVVIAVFAITYRQKLKTQKLITRQEKEINQQKSTELLRNQEVHYLNSMMVLQEKERSRIAADLHDGLGNFLATVRLYFDTLRPKINALTKEEQEQFDKASLLLVKASDETRKIAHDMSNGNLMQFGLVKAIEDVASIINSTKAIEVSVNSFDMEISLDQQLEVQLFKTIQELLNNVLKHAKAEKVTIQIVRHEDMLNVIVEDDGVGFSPPKIEKGLGFRSIEERVEEWNGEFMIDSREGVGTTVIVNIPIEA